MIYVTLKLLSVGFKNVVLEWLPMEVSNKDRFQYDPNNETYVYKNVLRFYHYKMTPINWWSSISKYACADSMLLQHNSLCQWRGEWVISGSPVVLLPDEPMRGSRSRDITNPGAWNRYDYFTVDRLRKTFLQFTLCLFHYTHSKLQEQSLRT